MQTYVHIEGSLGFVYDRETNTLHVRVMLAQKGHIIGGAASSDNSTARSRACRARQRARRSA